MKLLIITQKVDSNDQLLGFFTEWLERFAKKFEKLTILCLEKGKCDLPQNVEVISLGKDRGASKIKQLFSFYFLIFNLRKNYDVVFVHMNPIWMVLGGLCWSMLNKKRILWYTHKSVTFKLRLAEKFSDVILTASSESFRLRSSKVVVTGHGIDTEFFKPISGSRNVEISKLKILSVGRISPVKNYDTLIDAVKILKDEGLDPKVTMAGEPALDSDIRYLESLKLKIESLKLENNFDFVGKVNHRDLPGYYQSHNIFVHLSKTGSLDKTILEAMASGMSVVSSNDASRGFLPPGLIFNQDDPAELAAKIKNIRTAQVQNLRQYVVENHSLDKLIDKIYKMCVSKNITIYPFPFSSKSNKYIDLLYFKMDARVLESKSFSSLLGRKPGIIHIHWTNVVYGSKFFVKTLILMAWNFIILWLLKIKGHQVVWTKHNYYPHESKWIWLDKIGQWILFKTADAVTVHQKGEQNKKIIFIPHGNYINAYGPRSNKRAEIRNKFGFSEEDIVLISVGAIKPYKKIENIMAAFNAVQIDLRSRGNIDFASQNSIKLLIAGKCDREYAKKLKTIISDNIKLDCNFIPDDEIPDHLAAADYSIFWYDNSVLTSGGIVLSLSYGLPVIARNISAADLVKDGENGFLFNNERELSDIIKKLSNTSKFDPDKIIGTVENLNWENIAKQFMTLFLKL